MKNFKIAIALLGSSFVVGCSSMSGGENPSNITEDIAVLSKYELKDGFITIQAVGYGCTFFNSFKVEVADKAKNAMEVVRTKPDNCGMQPRNISLQYSYKHLGLDKERDILVTNPVKPSKTEYTASY